MIYLITTLQFVALIALYDTIKLQRANLARLEEQLKLQESVLDYFANLVLEEPDNKF